MTDVSSTRFAAVEPEGFASADALFASREATLDAIRTALRRAKVFVFTLGLTEAWQNRQTGLVYPVCPGTVRGTFDPLLHKFCNFGFMDTYGDMVRALELMRSINAQLRLLLTVSPVPLTATATGEHVLSATTYSKSVLRAVAGQLCEDLHDVDYFPSYEIMMDELRDYRFYADDMLHPSQLAIDYIWIKFFENYVEEKEFSLMNQVCEIQRALKHRPFNSNSESHKKFLENLNQKINTLVNKYPNFQF